MDTLGLPFFELAVAFVLIAVPLLTAALYLVLERPLQRCLTDSRSTANRTHDSRNRL
jgi:hypothetical protein